MSFLGPSENWSVVRHNMMFLFLKLYILIHALFLNSLVTVVITFLGDSWHSKIMSLMNHEQKTVLVLICHKFDRYDVWFLKKTNVDNPSIVSQKWLLKRQYSTESNTKLQTNTKKNCPLLPWHYNRGWIWAWNTILCQLLLALWGYESCARVQTGYYAGCPGFRCLPMGLESKELFVIL